MSDLYQSDAYIIEVKGETAGIVSRDGAGFRFHAAVHRFNPLDGMAFATPRAAEKAAARLLAGQARRRRQAALGRLGAVLAAP